MIVGCLISIASYFFGDQVTLPSYRAKTRLVSTLLGQKPSLSNSNVTVLSRGGTTIYHAGFYDDGAGSIAGLSVIERDSLGQPKARTEAASARWQGGAWLLSKVRRFDRTDDGQWKETDFGSYANPDFSEPIESFRSQNFDIGELTVTELGARATFQKNAGLPFSSTLAERHRRFAFAFVPLVVVLLSASIGGRYRKNVLLMSLLVSLVIATGYYVLQMIGMLLAKTGVLAPVIGAWAPLVVFGLLALALFGRART
jgi:lipopolysaccharide export system permease protein